MSARLLLAAMFGPRRESTRQASERYALSMLGYSHGSKRSIEVSPIRCPVATANSSGSEERA